MDNNTSPVPIVGSGEKRLKPPAMVIDIVADASFSPENKAGSYAFWITERGTGRSHQDCGRFRHPMRDSAHAELEALAKAIRTAVEVFDLTAGDLIVARSDCRHALDRIVGKPSNAKRWSMEKVTVNQVEALLRHRSIALDVEHVAGHRGTSDCLSAMNTWCDHMAKAAMAGHDAEQLFKAAG